MRNSGALFVFLVVTLAACAKPNGSLPQTAGDYMLYEAGAGSTAQQLSVIDSRSHAVERTLPLGVASPDWKHLYAVRAGTLLDFNPLTGEIQSMLPLPGGYQLPPTTASGIPGGLSQNGAYLVVERFEGGGVLPSTTHMLVISTVGSPAIQSRLDLRGDFQFDAVDNFGDRLYLIQYLNSTEYNVRLYDLLSGTLDGNIVVDKADGNQAMVGLRLSGVASPDGQWLYSMYIREHEAPFIHALSMQGPFAFCIDLPGAGYLDAGGAAEYRWSLAMSRDGSHLYAANTALGLVAEVQPATTYQPGVNRVAHITPVTAPSSSQAARELGANGAALTPDGSTLILSADRGIVTVDTALLRAHDRALGDWNVRSLVLTGDGSRLFAVSDSGMIAQVSMSGARDVTTFAGAPGHPLGLIRAAGVA